MAAHDEVSAAALETLLRAQIVARALRVIAAGYPLDDVLLHALALVASNGAIWAARTLEVAEAITEPTPDRPTLGEHRKALGAYRIPSSPPLPRTLGEARRRNPGADR
jgi:hypothetical protein